MQLINEEKAELRIEYELNYAEWKQAGLTWTQETKTKW